MIFSFISITFLFSLCIIVVLYYLCPIKYRWVVLLLSSILFYLSGGKKILLYTVILALVAYVVAIVIDKASDNNKTIYMSLGVGLFVIFLAIVKVCSYLSISAYLFVVPIGLSYYTLSIIGYMLDVFWKKDKAEYNFLHFLTFIIYFPKVLQGPISRHSFLGEKLIEGHSFDYKNMGLALQLILWGLFKKIVISDRANMYVTAVYGDLDAYGHTGMVLLLAIIMSSLQLYCDFSGYTDMAIGISQLFGVELEQNFNRPFLSKNVSEFWQRWHMTLSGWFKDYLFLPVSRSVPVKILSKLLGKRFGARVRKKTMIVMSTSVVWITTGLWHGTGINYLLWGFYWVVVFTCSEIFGENIERLNYLLKINTSAPSWKIWQMIRTFIIFSVGRLISSQSDLQSVKMIIVAVIRNSKFIDVFGISTIGLSEYDWKILIGSVILLIAVSLYQENVGDVRTKISEWNVVPRYAVYCVELTVIMLFGVYGSGYDMSTFAYQFF